MEATGKEVRLLLQKKLNEFRQQKGIKLSDMNLTDEEGKSLSEAQKSMLFSGNSAGLPHKKSNRVKRSADRSYPQRPGGTFYFSSS